MKPIKDITVISSAILDIAKKQMKRISQNI
jgi:hypothetical protein